MTAYTSRTELSLLPANRISYPAQYAPARTGVFARFVAFFQRQAAIREMSGLSERELRDIGLNRADLDRVFDDNFLTHRDR